MTTNWGPIVYPVALDTFAPGMIDNVDEVIANHPNSLAQAILEIEAKLNITNAPVQGTGGIAFDLTGHLACPSAPGVPTVWLNMAFASGHLYYTDAFGVDHDLTMGWGGIDIWTGWEEYWIDEMQGADIVGRGSLSSPFATLAFAATQIVAPTNQAEFLVPVVFHVRSGTYPDPVTLPPYRWHYTIDCVAGSVDMSSALVVWMQDNDYRFAAGITTYPNTLFVNGCNDSSMGMFVAQYDAASLSVDPPGIKRLTFADCRLVGPILNSPSGDPTKPTGDMRLSLVHCSSTVGGAIQSVDEDPFVVRNRIYLVTQDTVYTNPIVGDITIAGCDNTMFGVIGGTGADIIEGYQYGPGFTNCMWDDSAGPVAVFIGSSYLPFEYSVPETNYLKFDAQSFHSFTSQTFTLGTFMDPILHGNPTGYVLTDRANCLGVDAYNFAGHLLREHTSVQGALDWIDALEGTPEFGAIDFYVDPVAGNDDNDGITTLTPVQSFRMALRRLGDRPIRCPVRIFIQDTSGLPLVNVLPATIHIVVEGGGSFAICGLGDPVVDDTLTLTGGAVPGIGANGYGCIRLTGFTGAGVPWAADDAKVGKWLLPGLGNTYAGVAMPVTRSGADWVEIALAYSAGPTWTGDPDCFTIVHPLIVLTQQYPVEFKFEQRVGLQLNETGTPVEECRFSLSNFQINYLNPPA